MSEVNWCHRWALGARMTYLWWSGMSKRPGMCAFIHYAIPDFLFKLSGWLSLSIPVWCKQSSVTGRYALKALAGRVPVFVYNSQVQPLLLPPLLLLLLKLLPLPLALLLLQLNCQVKMNVFHVPGPGSLLIGGKDMIQAWNLMVHLLIDDDDDDCVTMIINIKVIRYKLKTLLKWHIRT